MNHCGRSELHRIVIAGGGAVGALLAREFVSEGIGVTVIDKAPGPAQEMPDDIVYVTADVIAGPFDYLSLLKDAQGVILALPEEPALKAAPAIGAAMQKGALLVDTLSVKSAIVEVFERSVLPLDVLSINPMFGPSLGFDGQPVIVVEVSSGPLALDLVRLMESWGARIVRCSAAEHDNTTASVQALTHAAVMAFGLALAEMEDDLGVDLGVLLESATPPFQVLTALLARISSGSAMTYAEIQAGHPHASRAREALYRGHERIASAAEADSSQMIDLLADIRRLVDPHKALLETNAYEIVRAIRS